MYEATGTIHQIFNTEQKTERLSIRKFVLEFPNKTNPKYPDLVEFELTGDRCELLDQFPVGKTVTVGFFIGGRCWVNPTTGSERFFNSLRVMQITAAGGNA